MLIPPESLFSLSAVVNSRPRFKAFYPPLYHGINPLLPRDITKELDEEQFTKVMANLHLVEYLARRVLVNRIIQTYHIGILIQVIAILSHILGLFPNPRGFSVPHTSPSPVFGPRSSI